MIAELGHYALVLALALTLVQSTLPFIGARNGDPVLMMSGSTSAIAAFIALFIIFWRIDLRLCDVRLFARQCVAELLFRKTAAF